MFSLPVHSGYRVITDTDRPASARASSINAGQRTPETRLPSPSPETRLPRVQTDKDAAGGVVQSSGRRLQKQHCQEQSGRQPHVSRVEKSWSPPPRPTDSGLAGHRPDEGHKLVDKRLRAAICRADQLYLSKRGAKSDNVGSEPCDISNLQMPPGQSSSSADQASKIKPDTDEQDMQASLKGLQEQFREVELEHQIVKWSSEKPESPAIDLASPEGWWESYPGMVNNQFIVIQLANGIPHKLNSLEMNLPGNEYSPRMCRLQYSTGGENGPWADAWRFKVEKKSDTRCRTSFATGSNNVKDFKEWLAHSYKDDIKEACKALFEGNESGFVTYPEFAAAISKCKRIFVQSGNSIPSWCVEVNKLFSDLLEQGFDKVNLEDLGVQPTGPPESAWWKISFENNWGSSKRLQVMSPLKVYSVMKVELGGISSVRGTFAQTAAMSRDNALVMAFDLETLGVSSENIQLRRLAKKYGISILEVEDMHSMYRASTQDEQGIDRESFSRLLLKLQGGKELNEIPSQRLQFFWQQADADCSGSIDFEEFVMFYDRYGDEISSRRNRRHNY